KTEIRRICILLVTAWILVCRMSATGVSAKSVTDPQKKGSFIIHYYDGGNQSDPVIGAVFTYYKIADLAQNVTAGSFENGFIPVITKENGKMMPVSTDTAADEVAQAVQKAYRDMRAVKGKTYTGKTGKDGKAVTENMEQGLYLAVETKPAENHLPSAPFIFMLPFTSEGGDTWEYLARAEPKPVPCGSLMISKKVTGSAGEKGRAFHFTVSLGAKGSFAYIRSDGKEGSLKDGDTIELSDGQSVTVNTLPSGTRYEITEKEAGKEGYTTSVRNEKGRIRSKKTVQVVFTNRKDPVLTPEPASEAETKRAGNVMTGDSANLWIPAAMMSAGALVLTVLLRRMRRGRKQYEET
ncbi:MAG: hypothetical protein IJ860_04865, partial [Eubacterium sp.]|nr:hypothetical protein [Eubacterium sp.]